MFDPEKVTIHLTGCESYYSAWISGEPMPEGWGSDPNAVRKNGWVSAEDYDQLLALYLASLVPNVKFWPCEEGNHLGCAVKKLIECGCECHKHHD